MHSFLFLQNIGAGEIIIIALVVLLLFGGKKIPELMKGPVTIKPQQFAKRIHGETTNAVWHEQY